MYVYTSIYVYGGYGSGFWQNEARLQEVVRELEPGEYLGLGLVVSRVANASMELELVCGPIEGNK